MFFNRNFWMPLAASLLAVCLYAQTPASSGAIEIYFSHPIDEGTAGDVKPTGIGYPMMLNAMIGRINQAEQQIDVAMYNNNRTDITNALKAAQARGVRVRYVASAAASNTALSPAPAFPVLYGNTEALMHNKFMIIDPDLPAKTWVMTGSVNWTTTNLIADHNNLLFIQDHALAKAYQAEFEEMWGGVGAQPVPANARFGSAKTNNTPHNFVIGGKMVQLWFSPSDGVTDQIVGALATANHRADFALFSFTKNEIGDILVDLHDDTGIPVQGMIENTSDLGCELGYLASQGLAVYGHVPPASLHHKYGVVDAGFPASQPLVITGSHNWSNAAETVNDENTLILFDAEVALLYQAEFNRRWSEIVSAENTPETREWQVFPNPVTDRLTLEAGTAPVGDILLVEIRDLTGRRLLSQQALGQSERIELDLHPAPPGQYLLTIISQDGVFSVPIQKI